MKWIIYYYIFRLDIPRRLVKCEVSRSSFSSPCPQWPSLRKKGPCDARSSCRELSAGYQRWPLAQCTELVGLVLVNGLQQVQQKIDPWKSWCLSVKPVEMKSSPATGRNSIGRVFTIWQCFLWCKALLQPHLLPQLLVLTLHFESQVLPWELAEGWSLARTRDWKSLLLTISSEIEGYPTSKL